MNFYKENQYCWIEDGYLEAMWANRKTKSNLLCTSHSVSLPDVVVLECFSLPHNFGPVRLNTFHGTEIGIYDS